jgi:hypothetical protein
MEIEFLLQSDVFHKTTIITTSSSNMRVSSVIRQTLGSTSTSNAASKFAPSPLAALIRSHIISSDSSTLTGSSSQLTQDSPFAESPIHLTIPNPFASRRISLRTQSDLLKSYPPSWLPPSRKNPSGSRTITYDQDGVKVTWTGGNHSSPTRRTPIPGKQITVKPSDKTKENFKGHKVDRVGKDRKLETQNRLDGMEKRIEDWRQVSLVR